MASKGEYVWRFELKPLSEDSGVTDGELVVGFVRTTLRELLDFIVLTQDEQEVKVDGFKLQGRPEKTYSIFGTD